MAKKNRERDASFVAFVVEQLDALGEVRAKSMFGGYGVYARETFFACVDDGRLYFRVDDASRPKYEARGMGPFAPMAEMVMKGYYEVPVDVIEDAAELTRWAREAMAAAPRKKAARAARRKSAKKGPATKRAATKTAAKTAVKKDAKKRAVKKSAGKRAKKK